jgi:hypothetical protein
MRTDAAGLKVGATCDSDTDCPPYRWATGSKRSMAKGKSTKNKHLIYAGQIPPHEMLILPRYVPNRWLLAAWTLVKCRNQGNGCYNSARVINHLFAPHRALWCMRS